MTDESWPAFTGPDYRESHVDSGESYDSRIGASAFDAYMDHWEALHVTELIRTRLGGSVARYLDFACGTGRVTAVIAPMAESTTGLDISDSMLEVARKKVPTARFLQGDITSEDLDVGEFDLVSAFRFFGNAQWDLRESVLRALNGRQPVGASLIANNHRNPMSVANIIARLRSDRDGELPIDLTHGRFRRLLHETGYEITEVRPIAVWQYRAALMRAAGSDPEKERKLERRFGGPALARFAPDTVVLARKVRDLDHAG